MKFAWVGLAVCLFASAQDGADFTDLARRASTALQSDPKQAVDLYRQAIALKPAWAEGWFYLGTGLYEMGQYPESRKAFQQAAGLAPQKGAVWAFLGLCDYQLTDYDGALSSIQKGEALGLPDNRQFVSTVHNRAALIYMRARDFSAAIEQLKPLALLGDDSAATIQAFGVSALGMPYLPPQIPAVKQPAVELAGRAEWAMSAARDGDAVEPLRELAAQFPKEPGVHYLNGIYLMAHDPAAARAEFQKELQISPSHVAARLQIAILDIRAGDSAPAAALSLQAVRLQPENPLARAVLGRAYMQQNEFAKALPELLSAAKLAPTNPQLHLYLQQVYRRLGRTAEAQKELAEFVRLHSEHDSSGLPEIGDASSGKK